MPLQISQQGILMEHVAQPKMGDIIPAHGRIMRIETITIQDFVMYVLSGGVPLHGYDEIVINEDFVTTAKDDSGIGEIVGGMVTLIWVNKYKS